MSARVIAHRGARTRRDGSRIRENTLEAFERAIKLGADGIDFDVRRTADDVLVIHHDVHLDDGRRVREIDSSELPEWLPTLAEALEVCSDTWLNIEVKNLPGDPDYDETYGISLAVAALVQAFEATDRVHVSS
ncbi:MAG: glycerophosphodiester phosphodiesterase, partial [Acidimicrobiales bacterium]